MNNNKSESYTNAEEVRPIKQLLAEIRTGAARDPVTRTELVDDIKASAQNFGRTLASIFGEHASVEEVDEYTQANWQGPYIDEVEKSYNQTRVKNGWPEL